MKSSQLKTIVISLILSVAILAVSNCKKNENGPYENGTSTGSVTGNSNTGGVTTSNTSGTTGATGNTTSSTMSTAGTGTAGTTGA